MLLVEAPSPLAQASLSTGNLFQKTSDADAIMAAHLATDELLEPEGRAPGQAGRAEAPPPVPAAAAGAATGAGAAEEPFVNFLDELLDEPAPIERNKVRPATDTLFDDAADAALDPNFAALPEVPPEIEAAFASLSEADVMTFLTLDGDAAMAFLQSRIARAGQEPPASAAPAGFAASAPEPPARSAEAQTEQLEGVAAPARGALAGTSTRRSWASSSWSCRNCWRPGAARRSSCAARRPTPRRWRSCAAPPTPSRARPPWSASTRWDRSAGRSSGSWTR